MPKKNKKSKKRNRKKEQTKESIKKNDNSDNDMIINQRPQEEGEKKSQSTQQQQQQQKQQELPPPASTSFSWAATFAKVSSIKPAEGLEDDNEFFTSQSKKDANSLNSGVAKVAELAKSCCCEGDHATDDGPKDQQNDENDLEKQKMTEKKKRKRDEDTEEENMDANENEDENNTTKRKKKKKSQKKKKQKNHHHNQVQKEEEIKEEHESANNSNGEDDKEKNNNAKEEESFQPSPTVPLEGRMISLPSSAEMIMVLVDKKNNIVYTTPPQPSSSDDDDDDDDDDDRVGGKDSEYDNNGMVAVGTLNENKEVMLDLPKLFWLKNDNGATENKEHATKKKEEQSTGTATPDDSSTNTISPSFPYEVEPDDHCETPLESYEDIVPLLQKLKSSVNNSGKDIAIYDPYFCDGSVITNLSNLGFPNVYNKKEDCYAVWKRGVGYPNYDVLITNPPYSSDHIQKLMHHITSPMFGDKPWFLLLPKFVHKKDYYTKALHSANCQPFYLVPKKRYVYVPPKNFRSKKASDVHKKSSPFVSMWYIWGGSADTTRKLADYYIQQSRGSNGSGPFSRCDIARSKSALRDLRRKGR